jgi:hypothetical protein
MQTLNTLDLMQVNGGVDDAVQKPDFSNVISRVTSTEETRHILGDLLRRYLLDVLN